MSQFNAQQVPITVTLNFSQINLILEGLGKLPFEKVESLYLGLRAHGLTTLQQAEEAHKQAALENTTTPAITEEPQQ
mgnify:CR=1 FL=1